MHVTGISAANVLRGTVASLRERALHATLAVSIGGPIVRVDVPMGPVRHQRIAEDDEVLLVFKTTDVILGGRGARWLPVSVASQIDGVVRSISVESPGIEALVEVEVTPGVTIAASVDPEMFDDLGIETGRPVLVLITDCDVMPAR